MLDDEPELDDINTNHEGNRRQQQLEKHNRAIQEHNEYHRQFSRYEWAVREGRADATNTNDPNRHLNQYALKKEYPYDGHFLFNKTNVREGRDPVSAHTNASTIATSIADSNSSLPLIRTSWKAIEISFLTPARTSNDTTSQNNTAQLQPILSEFPITISIESYDSISGSAGCNRYFGPLINLTATAFSTSNVGTTRMLCREDGVMEQERKYVNFMRERSFSYEIVNTTLNGTVEKELLLRQPNDTAEGEVLARFQFISYTLFDEDIDYATTTSTNDIDDSLPLVGTTWQATEYMPSFTTQLQSTVDGYAITISFELSRISGRVGCNGYGGDMTKLTSSTFHVGILLQLLMYCIHDGVMDQEDSFMHLLTDRSFYYEIVDLDGQDAKMLVLSELMNATGGNAKKGEVVARFVQVHDAADSRDDKCSVGVADMDSNNSFHTDATTDVRMTKATGVGASEVVTKKKGGLFNAYQTAPLHQGYGTHYATIWVGTPPQRKSVIIDTGSHYTAFPCKGCDNCGEEHHTDKYFDPDASSTFRALTCSECQSSSCSSDRCVFSQTYTEGSSWHAYESIDKVFVGGKDVKDSMDPKNHAFKSDFLFGCQTKETGLFVTQLADGIMGMSAHPSTLPKVMYEQGKLEHNMFSMCFRRELHVSKQGIVAGILTLGGIDTRADTSPMVYARNVATTGWFTVYVKNIYVREKGGQSAKPDDPQQRLQRVTVDLFEMNSGKGVIVDSGTTDTYLHKSIAEPFNEVWQKVTGRSYSNTPVAMSKKDLLLLPTVLIQMAVRK